MVQPRTLITGAASGIGKALAERLAADGHALVLVDIQPLDDVAGNAPDVLRAIGDVADEQFWTALEPKLAGLTHTAVNAGVAGLGAIDETTLAEWRRIMAINLDGAFLTLRSAVRAMKRSSGPRAAVLTSSITAIKAEAGASAYCASKAGVMQLTKAVAKELAPIGIRVNAIAPGGVDTAIWDSMDFFGKVVANRGSRQAAIEDMGKAGTAIGRYATADEIAGQIAFLLSDSAATITGAILRSDGGYSL
ncbi:MAG: SDR family oxidoreductase [Sphingomicrobium sp.]